MRPELRKVKVNDIWSFTCNSTSIEYYKILSIKQNLVRGKRFDNLSDLKNDRNSTGILDTLTVIHKYNKKWKYICNCEEVRHEQFYSILKTIINGELI